ncbi:hypothetical protein [Sphingomonas japonica]|uniref:PAS domain-containing protein n=1 Tax=Sphingomonas japonica TaxID=511662 RepID=A0ABX0U2U7_9SPHN|nr:hypothetical protein [Sphingomonas japonica]NIJ24893.1 PAS domain-containing protein [Sphingomonas japonica]
MSRQSPIPTERNSVSASELVRQFGLWQEQAAREPVYVMHRGRARLVLTSVDLMKRLCAPRDTAAAMSIEHALLLDMMREPVIRLDSDVRVIGINPAAEAWLGQAESDAAGSTLSEIMSDGIGTYCDALVRRSCRFATIETAELPLGSHHMTVTIAPTSPGALLVGVEHSSVRDADPVVTVQHPMVAAMAAIEIGNCRINLRGYVDAADAALAELTGLSADMLQTARFVSLFAVGSRVAIGDALDQVLRDGVTRSVDATLHRNRAADLPVAIGIAPVRPRAAIEAAIAVVRAQSC